MSSIRVPLLGTIATGMPIAVPASDLALLDDASYIEISADLLPPDVDHGELFALEVRGTGMVEAGLYDCDIVVLQPVTTWLDGDILAVWFPERSATVLTRLYRDGQGYRLQAANAQVKPVRVAAGQRLEVKGKVVAMIRTIRD